MGLGNLVSISLLVSSPTCTYSCTSSLSGQLFLLFFKMSQSFLYPLCPHCEGTVGHLSSRDAQCNGDAQLAFSKEAKEIFMENLVRIWHLASFCSFESPTLQEQSKQMYAPMLINPFGEISKKILLGLETFEEREISCQPDAEIYLVPQCGPNHQSPPRLPFLLGV